MERAQTRLDRRHAPQRRTKDALWPSAVEKTRLRLSKSTGQEKKSRYGQFFTPQRTASFMAGLFPDGKGRCRLLDAGAGIGSLSAAFLERWQSAGFHFERVELDAFEVDDSLHAYLSKTLEQYKNHSNCIPTIRKADFIHVAADRLAGGFFADEFEKYTHVILNPPYKKISAHSLHRLAMRKLGIEAVNLYSAFVSLAIALTVLSGQIVAIIPRSFCNGPYYRPFRNFILAHTAIQHIHLFKSRDQTFKDDKVLQENIIIRLERCGQQGPVTVSTSTDDTFVDLRTCEQPFEQIVSPHNPQRFIHVPMTSEGAVALNSAVRCTLFDLGVNVSTGPVVDFRLKKYLHKVPRKGSVPLLYPCHFKGTDLAWPILDAKKPNAIVRNNDTERWLYPNGFYCVVRRFSSKEERRRIVASVVSPKALNHAKALGFENHLNLFHENRHGLAEALAYGLAVFLNSTAVDDYFRCFSGHTQVNAADLKFIKYPSRDHLISMGQWAVQRKKLTQEMIDARLAALSG